MIQKVAKKD